MHAQSGQWTWMQGADSAGSNGNYGIKGVPDSNNNPCGRYQSAYWTDKAGNFWMFGGVTWQSAPHLEQNDLWKYDVNTNMWTWINGPQFNGDVNGNFGIKGIPSINNYPSVRGWGANCWTDTSGMLWLFGGYGTDANGLRGELNDLWRYNIATNEWTWMSGDSIRYVATVFGTKQIYNMANTPGSMQECKSSWVDNGNNFYMFGGKRYFAEHNNVWKYSSSINQWAWQKGDSNANNTTGTYGILGAENAANTPSNRCSYSKWMDPNGKMYLYAGARFADTANWSDVWRYNPTTNNWAWMGGPNLKNTPIPYNNKCITDSLHVPSPRLENQTAATYGCTNAFYTFGGFNYAKNETYNDLWLFNTQTNKWTWLTGQDTAAATNNYGVKYTPSSTNNIGARCGAAIWTDANNNLWVFGGINENVSNVVNDMWRFTPDTSCFNAMLHVPVHLPNFTDTNICKGDTLLINIDSFWQVQVTPNTYFTANADSTKLYFYATNTTTYTLQAIENNNYACGQRDKIVFTMHIVAIDTPTLIFNNKNICAGDTISQSIFPLQNNYTIFPNNNVVNTGNSIQFFPQTTTSYTITASSKAACGISVVDSFKLQVAPILKPQFNFDKQFSICPGDTIYISVDSNTSYSYTQNIKGTFLSNQLVLYPTSNTQFYLTGVTNGLCGSVDSVLITINITPQPNAQFNFNPAAGVIKGVPVQLINSSINANTYQWFFKNLIFDSLANSSYTFDTIGVQCITLKALNGACVDTITHCIKVHDDSISYIYLPNAFSPNGDDLNDLFAIIFKNITPLSIHIYNRYGNEVYYRGDFSVFWDGYYKGLKCDVGTYFYQIQYLDSKGKLNEKFGDISLVK
jgi:gliding motility-associated-like protein